MTYKELRNRNLAWKEKKDKTLFADPFEVLTEEMQERLGVGPDSLVYDELRHNGFQREYAKDLLIREEMKNADRNAIQEKVFDRYKKSAAEF